MSYKRIIVAIDDSKASEMVLVDAINLSKSLHAKLCIVHVAIEAPVQPSEFMFLDEYKELAKEDGLAVLERGQQFSQKEGIEADTHLIEVLNAIESISKKIIEYIPLWQAELLILGTHGRRGFNRLFLGSVAEETVRIATIPVLLIRAREEIKK
jgi:nucleotide-binding universal stress UspA family protein